MENLKIFLGYLVRTFVYPYGHGGGRLNTGVMVIIPASLPKDARFSTVAVAIVY
jgi:hypothetical protein